MIVKNGDLTNKELLIRIDERQSGILTSIHEIKEDLKCKADKEDVEDLKKQVSNIKLASIIVGGIGGILTSLGAFLGLRKV